MKVRSRRHNCLDPTCWPGRCGSGPNAGTPTFRAENRSFPSFSICRISSGLALAENRGPKGAEAGAPKIKKPTRKTPTRVQLRDQNGGYHRWSQNHMRIHFGLADNTLVDLRVEWPSGQIDLHDSVAVDRLYRITEGGGISVIGGVTPGSTRFSVRKTAVMWRREGYPPGGRDQRGAPAGRPRRCTTLAQRRWRARIVPVPTK